MCTGGAGMGDEPQATAAPQAPPGRGSLAPVSLGLGLAGLVVALVPFYGLFTGLPLAVVALVLGLVARSRPWESRGQALSGVVAGALGLLVSLAWLGSFAWGALGIGSASSQTSVSVGAELDSGLEAPPPDVEELPEGESPEPEGPVEVVPGDPGPQLGTGLSGEASLTVEAATRTLTLEDCALARATTRGILVRGRGPDGRVTVSSAGGMGRLVLALDLDDEVAGTYMGEVTATGTTDHGGVELFGDGHELELDGQLRDLHSTETVEIELTVTCS